MKPKFLFTEEAKYSYTHNDILYVLLEWLKYWMNIKKLNKNNCCLINGTACTGWDNIFLTEKLFNYSILFEISDENYNYLIKNLSIYMEKYKAKTIENKNNIKYVSSKKIIAAYKADTTKQIEKIDETIEKAFNLKSYIIYLDVPWTGKDYDKIEKINLTFGDFTLEQFIDKIFLDCKNISYLLLKLPFNYNKELLFNSISKKIKYHLIEFNRMFFVLMNL